MSDPSHHLEYSDEEFEVLFKNRKLPPHLFSHDAHLRLAWIHIRKYGFKKAVNHICDQISAFDQTFGDGQKFNRTLTIQSMNIINERVKRSLKTDYAGFIAENRDLVTGFDKLVQDNSDSRTSNS
jgi:hypothetical protein